MSVIRMRSISQMAANVAALLKRRSELRAERDQYADLWQEIAEHVVPHKSNITRLLAPGERQTRRIFDSTAIHAAETLAASIHGTLTPGTQPWLSLKVRQEALNDNGEVKDWLEDCARRIHAALRQSNWTTSVHEMYLDLVGPAGMGLLFVEEKAPPAAGTFGGFRFSTHGPGEYTVSEDAEGRIDTVFREMSLTARAIVMKWADKGGDKVQEAATNKPDERFTVLHAVYPRATYAKPGRAGSLTMAWASCYIVVETRAVLDEGGFQEFPFMAPRWAKTSGEVYGRGPSHTALPDIRTLNTAKEFLLQAAPLAMFPPTIEADDAVIGDPDLTPAGRNYINTMGGRSPAELFGFMQTGLKIDLSQIVIADLRQSIRDMYFSHQLELQDKPTMTATEVQVRYEMMQRILGPTLGRLETEFLNPLVERCFALMARARALLPTPDVLVQATGGEQADLDIQYEGPLARAQRTVELTAQDRVLAFVAALTQAMAAAGVPPSQAAAVWDVLKVDKWVRDRSEITGIRSDSLHSEEETDQIRTARAQAEAQQAQLQQAQQVAEIAQKGAPMLKALHEASQPANGNQQAAAA